MTATKFVPVRDLSDDDLQTIITRAKARTGNMLGWTPREKYAMREQSRRETARS